MDAYIEKCDARLAELRQSSSAAPTSTRPHVSTPTADVPRRFNVVKNAAALGSVYEARVILNRLR